MIEPGDIQISEWNPSHVPFPFSGDSNVSVNGRVTFLDRPNEETVDVGNVFERTFRMGGERPITVKIAELDLYGSGQWIPVKDVKVPHGYLGFKLRIETKSRFAGNHKLQYTATNSVPGGPIWIQSLNLRERSWGG